MLDALITRAAALHDRLSAMPYRLAEPGPYGSAYVELHAVVGVPAARALRRDLNRLAAELRRAGVHTPHATLHAYARHHALDQGDVTVWTAHLFAFGLWNAAQSSRVTVAPEPEAPARTYTYADMLA